MSLTFMIQQLFSVDNVSIPAWDLDKMERIELIELTGTILRLRAYTSAFFYDESFEHVADLYEDGGDNDFKIDELECKFEFQIDFDIRNLSHDGLIRSIDFELLNISDIRYQIPMHYISREINRSVLNREIKEMLKRSVTDEIDGISQDGFTLNYSLS